MSHESLSHDEFEEIWNRVFGAASIYAANDMQEEKNEEATAKVSGQNDVFRRIPGLFRRWEFSSLMEPSNDFHLENAGTTSDGTHLFAIYRRESNQSARPKSQAKALSRGKVYRWPE